MGPKPKPKNKLSHDDSGMTTRRHAQLAEVTWHPDDPALQAAVCQVQQGPSGIGTVYLLDLLDYGEPVAKIVLRGTTEAVTPCRERRNTSAGGSKHVLSSQTSLNRPHKTSHSNLDLRGSAHHQAVSLYGYQIDPNDNLNDDMPMATSPTPVEPVKAPSVACTITTPAAASTTQHHTPLPTPLASAHIAAHMPPMSTTPSTSASPPQQAESATNRPVQTGQPIGQPSAMSSSRLLPPPTHYNEEDDRNCNNMYQLIIDTRTTRTRILAILKEAESPRV